MGDEAVAVGAGPGGVFVRIGIAGDGGSNFRDQRLGAVAADIEDEAGLGAEPVIVGAGAILADR
jgi:hypothetical protein